MKFILKIIFILFLLFISPSNNNQVCAEEMRESVHSCEIINKNHNSEVVGFINNRQDFISNSLRNSEISQSQNRNNTNAGNAFGALFQSRNLLNQNYYKNINYNSHVLHSISPKLKNVLIARAP